MQNTFPTELEDDEGRVYAINPSYHTMLKIMRLWADVEVHQIHKINLALKWFFPTSRPEDLKKALELIQGFLTYRSSDKPENKKVTKRQFCYEFDAEEIYTSFIQAYRIDLIETDMHWFKFQILLANLPTNTAFGQKIQLRFASTKGLKGEELNKLNAAKKKVQLPKPVEKVDVEEQKRLKEIWDKITVN